MIHSLIGGLEHDFYIFHTLGIIVLPDSHIFQMGSKHQAVQFKVLMGYGVSVFFVVEMGHIGLNQLLSFGILGFLKTWHQCNVM